MDDQWSQSYDRHLWNYHYLPFTLALSFLRHHNWYLLSFITVTEVRLNLAISSLLHNDLLPADHATNPNLMYIFKKILTDF